MATQWTFHYLADGVFQVKDNNSDTCLTIPEVLEDMPLYMDFCDASNERQQYVAQNGEAAWGDRFELNPAHIPDGCVGSLHNPKYGEMLYVWKCELSRQWTTSLWNFF
jgi:hypothetical protein